MDFLFMDLWDYRGLYDDYGAVGGTDGERKFSWSMYEEVVCRTVSRRVP